MVCLVPSDSHCTFQSYLKGYKVLFQIGPTGREMHYVVCKVEYHLLSLPLIVMQFSFIMPLATSCILAGERKLRLVRTSRMTELNICCSIILLGWASNPPSVTWWKTIVSDSAENKSTSPGPLTVAEFPLNPLSGLPSVVKFEAQSPILVAYYTE